MALKIVLSTCSAADAESLARALVGERLAACCNRVPGVRSTYWWEGALQDEAECLLIFKTADEAVPALMQRLRELHPYEVPEIVVLPVETALEPYLDWVRRETRPSGSP